MRRLKDQLVITPPMILSFLLPAVPSAKLVQMVRYSLISTMRQLAVPALGRPAQ
jgi:hypothetical protein